MSPSIGSSVAAEILEGLAGIDAYRDEWERVFAGAGHEPSTSFEWTAAMVRHHVRPGDRGWLVRLARGGVAVGLVPLVARPSRVLGLRVVTLAPISEQYNTHSDLLVSERTAEVADAFVAALGRLGARWDCFRMSRLLEANPLTVLLADALGRAGHLRHRRDGLPAYFLPLPSTYAEYLAGRSAKFRNYLKRIQRKMHAAGTVEVNQLRDPSRFGDAFDELLAVERASWKQAHGTAISAVRRQTGFYGDMCPAASAAGRLHLQWLRLDGAPVAYNLGYLKDGCYFYLKTSFDDRHKALSPATYLRARLIEDLIAAGVTRFDFPGEPYEWERQWTETVRWREVVSGYPATLRGRGLALMERLQHRPRPRVVPHLDPRAARGPRPQTA